MEVNMQYYDKYDVGKRIRMLRKNKVLELENILETRSKGEKLFVKKIIEEIIDNVSLLYN
jgi:hypothetical protein